MSIRPALLAIAVAVVTAGCGSTVVVSPTGTRAGGQELSVPSPGSNGAQGLSLPSAAATGRGAAGRRVFTGGSMSGSTTGAASAGTAPGTGSGPATPGRDGPGVTPTRLYVGESWDPNIARADAAVGAASGDPGDIHGETNAMIKYINDHGGVAHRKIAAVWHQISTSDDASTSAEATCQAWTRDNKVFVLDGANFSGAGTLMDECAQHEGGIELIGGSITMQTTEVESHYPEAFDLNGLSNDRAMRYTVAGLSQLGYLSAGARVGIVTWDDPFFRYGVSHDAEPALAALGFNHVPVAYVSSPSSYGDLAATSAAVSSAVLRFSSTVDHVIIFDGASGVTGGGILTLEWMQQAHSQHYRPRYGLNSGSGFNALASDLPADQLVNSVGVGWMPALEQTSHDFATMKKPAQAKLCEQIMNRAGQPASSANAIANQLGICDFYFLLKQALDSVSGPLNQLTAIAAFNAIGTRHQSLVNFGAKIDPQRRDLPYLVRNMTYQSTCSCFRYVGPIYNPESV